MAKTPVTRDRFRIHAETSSEQVGAVLAELTKMGLDAIGYELITDVKRWHSNSNGKVHETSAAEAIMEWTKEHPTFEIKNVIAHFRATDRTPGAAYAGVKTLVEKKFLKKLGDGNYQRSDIKAIAAPAKSAVKADKEEPQRARYDVSNKDLIWNHFKSRQKFTASEVSALFRSHERNPKSISPQLSILANEKRIKAKGDGNYEVVKAKAKAPPASAPHNRKDRDRLRKQAFRAKQKKEKQQTAPNATVTESSPPSPPSQTNMETMNHG